MLTERYISIYLWAIAWMSSCCSVYLCAKYDSILYVDYYKVLNMNNIDRIKK